MPTDHRSTLAAIKRFDQLIAYLRDEMNWPIDSEDFEDLTFEYTPDELGIDNRNAARIQEIKRLRPLATNQPWGIFFVKFEPKRLPVLALRSILGRVALKKRASANSAERQAWATEDLLFVSNYGEGEVRQISFAHFAAPTDSSKLPTLKVLGWDGLDTPLHLDHVAQELTAHLAWPEDEDDAFAWREQWRAAFTLRHREVVTTSRDLSIRLAGLARSIRDRVRAALEMETENGRITKLMEAFQKALVHDLDIDSFADMVAQTIAYGLLSARIADPQQGTATDLASHMRTNPLLRDLMSAFLQVGGEHTGMEIDFDELGVAEVMELLDRANMEAVLRDFGDRNPREDPVIHFYESFLAEYDKQKKVERGVFYTPRPVVSWIVRSIDALLRSEIGLEDGLADTSTWGEMARKNKALSIPEGISPDQEFVQILDPATGTGTFLVEVIDLIHRTLIDKWSAQGHGEKQIESLWNKYVARHLLTRLHGYELLMAPYAIAHLKIGLKLYEAGYNFGSGERARVYLTNALEHDPTFQVLFDFAIPALAHEAQAVNEIKAEQRFTVVLGNPPYSGHSANKGEWIGTLLRGRNGGLNVENYFEIGGNPLNERNPKWVNNDYVKFIRLAHWEIERTGIGLVGFITSNSYLDSPTFRGMRESMAATFPTLYLLDLHGNSKKGERSPDGGRDENVFDIQEGVAVGLFSKPIQAALPRCSHADLWGDREFPGGGGKYGWLEDNDVLTTIWTPLSPKPPLGLFVPRDELLKEEYEAGWRLTDIFPVNSVGIVTARDKLAIQWTAEDMERVVDDFVSRDSEEARIFYMLGKDARDWKVTLAQEDILKGEGKICPILYRPFDRRFTYYTGNSRGFICMPRPEVMRHMLTGYNLALHLCRQTVTDWQHCLVTNAATDDCYVSNKTRERGYTHPLYTYPKEEQAGWAREPNLVPEFTQAFADAVGLDFIREGNGDLSTTFGPEDIFHYLYSVLHSPKYRRRYADSLKSDFPLVPLPGSQALFSNLCRPGARLISLHLMEAQSDEVPITFFPVPGSNQVDKVRYTAPAAGLSGRVWINRAQYFDDVPQATYAFTMGGYRPAEKWLKDRKGRILTEDDIVHYQKVIAALAKTRSLMTEIDEIIEAHGGWPAAFQAEKAEYIDTEIIPFPRIVEPEPEERYATCVPFIPLRVAAGTFSGQQYVEEDEGFEWVAVDSGHRLRKGMFVAQVVGKSMEPAIPDGAYCLFRASVEGTRQGKTVLIQLRDAIDPETGQRYTVKRYDSQRQKVGDSWRHTRITLNPVNPDFEPIVLTGDAEGELQVVAELVEVLGGSGDE